MTTPFDLDLPTVTVITEWQPGDAIPDNAIVPDWLQASITA